MKSMPVAAAVAASLVKSLGVEVQEAKPARIKGEDGKERDGYRATRVPLAARHVLSARAYEDGRLVVVTNDGKKHATTCEFAKLEAEAAEVEAKAKKAA